MANNKSETLKHHLNTTSPSGFEQWFHSKSEWLVGIVAFIFIVSGVVTLNNYGVTWDEGLGDLFFGEKDFRFLASFDSRNLSTDIDIPSRVSNDLNLNPSPFRHEPFMFPGFSDIPPTITKYISAYWLKWLNPVDGFHIYPIVLAGLFLWYFFRFVAYRSNKFAAFLALIFIATFPRFWGDMHFNVKDVPEAIFFSFTLMSFLDWYEKPNIKRALLAGVFMGFAIAVKANAIFIPLILFTTIMPWNICKPSWESLFKHFTQYRRHYLAMIIISISTYILSWPFLYPNPYFGLKAYWGHILYEGAGDKYQWQIDPLRQVITTMPEVMLIFLIIGLIILLGSLFRNKNNNPFWHLVIVWLIFPVLRVSIPSGVNFDGVRHFLEFVPAAAIIAGFGLDQSINWVVSKNWIQLITARIVVIILIIINLFQAYTLFYPYMHLYYNQFVGGLAGAKDKFLGNEATDYWAGSYRPGMEWVNKNAPPNSYLVVPVAGWVADLEAPVFLRSDIHLVDSMPDYPIMKASATPYYIMFILRGDLGNAQDEVDYTLTHAELAHQIVIDDVPILRIYRFGGQ